MLRSTTALLDKTSICSVHRKSWGLVSSAVDPAKLEQAIQLNLAEFVTFA
jgi:hypothetical protein